MPVDLQGGSFGLGRRLRRSNDVAYAWRRKAGTKLTRRKSYYAPHPLPLKGSK